MAYDKLSLSLPVMILDPPTSQMSLLPAQPNRVSTARWDLTTYVASSQDPEWPGMKYTDYQQ